MFDVLHFLFVVVRLAKDAIADAPVITTLARDDRLQLWCYDWSEMRCIVCCWVCTDFFPVRTFVHLSAVFFNPKPQGKYRGSHLVRIIFGVRLRLPPPKDSTSVIALRSYVVFKQRRLHFRSFVGMSTKLAKTGQKQEWSQNSFVDFYGQNLILWICRQNVAKTL